MSLVALRNGARATMGSMAVRHLHAYRATPTVLSAPHMLAQAQAVQVRTQAQTAKKLQNSKAKEHAAVTDLCAHDEARADFRMKRLPGEPPEWCCPLRPCTPPHYPMPAPHAKAISSCCTLRPLRALPYYPIPRGKIHTRGDI